MKILRYLNRDVLTHTLAISAVLLIIIFSGRFSKYLAQAAAGDLAVDILLPVMLYRMPGFLELIVPMGLFIGILMAYGRLYVDSEMVVMSACGISQRQLALYTLAPASCIAILVALLSLYVTPLGAARSQALLQDPKSSQGLSTLTAGRFQVRNKGDVVTYTETIDSESGVMKRIFVAQQQRDKDGRQQMRVTVAREGEFVTLREAGVRYFELRDGHSYEGVPGNVEYRATSFASFGELIPELEGGVRDTDPVDGRSTRVLLSSTRLEDRAALQWRLSLPLMVPIIAVIAMAMSKTNHRRGRYIKMLPALLLYLGYLMAQIKVRSGRGPAVRPGPVVRPRLAAAQTLPEVCSCAGLTATSLSRCLMPSCWCWQ
jgi:lipopolysaccharide export system permease protein